MAVDVFLVIPNLAASGPVPITVSAEPIQDEYFATTFKGAAVVEVRTFTVGVENTTTIGTATSGAGIGKAQFEELVIDKPVDKLSRSLFALSVTGAHLKKVQLYLRRSGGEYGARPYLVYGFETVFINKIDWSVSSGDDYPFERVTFLYGALALGYYAQRPDGTLEAPTKMSWSQILNKQAETDLILSGF